MDIINAGMKKQRDTLSRKIFVIAMMLLKDIIIYWTGGYKLMK